MKYSFLAGIRVRWGWAVPIVLRPRFVKTKTLFEERVRRAHLLSGFEEKRTVMVVLKQFATTCMRPQEGPAHMQNHESASDDLEGYWIESFMCK